jgi:hypothetical protein
MSPSGRTTHPGELAVSDEHLHWLASNFHTSRSRTTLIYDPAFSLSSSFLDDPHPLFSPSNFVGELRDLYGVLLPALQLASRLLKHPSCTRYWTTLLFGERKVDSFAYVPFAETAYRISSLKNPDDEEARYLAAMLNIMFTHIKYVSADLSSCSNSPPGRSSFARRRAGGRCKPSDISQLERHWNHPSINPFDYDSEILLDHSLKDAAERLHTGHINDPKRQLRFNLYTAITIYHKLSHAADDRARYNVFHAAFHAGRPHHD